jgi:3-oxoacyl-(acyl-carrier-protein) synthase
MSAPGAVVSGRGVLSPLACDWASFAEGVRTGRRAPLAPFPGSAAPDPPLYHLLSDPGAVDAGEGEPLSALAVAAVRAALEDAGLAGGEGYHDDIGLVMNTVFGPSTALEAYLERLRERGPRGARPAQFVDTLLSMPASRVGMALRLRGSTAVLGGSSPFELALDWVRQGRERAVVAGGAEHGSAKCARYLRLLAERSGAARAAPAQGAGFVVVETAERARERGARPLAWLLGAGAASEPQEVALPWSADPAGRALAVAMGGALAEAGLAPEAVDAVVLASGDDGSEAGELAALEAVFGPRAGSLALVRPKRLLGEALGASAALGLLAALAALEKGGGAALANAFEMGGGATSLALRVPS